MAKAPKYYTSDYMSRTGMAFAIDINDPAKRMQEYLDRYKNDPVAEVRCNSHPMTVRFP